MSLVFDATWQWLCSERLVERLVGLFGVGSEPALHGNAAQLLCDLLRLLRDVHAQNSHLLPSLHETSPEVGVGDQPDVDPIVSVLEAKSTTDQLLEQMLGGPVTESAVVHGITVLLTLLEVRRPPYIPNFNFLLTWDLLLDLYQRFLLMGPIRSRIYLNWKNYDSCSSNRRGFLFHSYDD